jgi:NAD+ diphosphatase
LREAVQCYAGAGVDRASVQRKDRNWLASQLAKPTTKILPFWHARYLINQAVPQAPRAIFLRRDSDQAPLLLEEAAEIVFLGLEGDNPVFAVDLSDLDKAAVYGLFPEGVLVALREVGSLLVAQEAGLFAYACGILNWHRRNRFCSACGHRSESRHGGHMRCCSNPACAQEIFPRLDPVVIMLVEHRPDDGSPPMCLLGRHSGLPPGVYSTLAGFVEPGERLEEAVKREVFEEVGCRVEDVVYQASQPWPFPGSLMIGFRARAETTALSLDRNEIEDARWFTAAELLACGKSQDEGTPLRISRKDSIAWFLIKSWLVEVANLNSWNDEGRI